MQGGVPTSNRATGRVGEVELAGQAVFPMVTAPMQHVAQCVPSIEVCPIGKLGLIQPDPKT